MPLAVQIREAQDHDSGSVALLLAEMGHTVDAATVRANLHAILKLAPLFRTFVAVRGPSLVGAVSAFASPVLHRPDPVGRVSLLVVTQTCTGQGIGSSLLLQAEGFLRGLGCGRIEVTSATHRLEAHAFYRRRGYTQQGLRFIREFVRREPV
jgi:GNAT superfamily N-acetyltransferase